MGGVAGVSEPDASKAEENWTAPESVAGVRHRILNTILVIIAVVPPVAILLSIPRFLEFGLRPVQYVAIGLFAAVVVVTLLRHRLSYRFKSLFLLVGTFVVGVVSLVNWGMVGMYAVFFIGVIFIAALLLSFRAGLLTLGATIVVMIGTGLLVRFGVVSFDVDYPRFSSALSTWVLATGHVAVFALLILVGFHRLHQALLTNITQLGRRSEELVQMNVRLQGEIGVRERTEDRIRESEGRYRLLADNSTDMIWTADAGLRTTYVSPQVASLRGFSVDEALTQSLDEVVAPASLASVRQALEEELALWRSGPTPKDRVRTIEAEMIRKDGSTVWTETRARVLGDGSGRPAAILGVSRDISERRQLEGQLLQSQKMEAIGRLAGGVAHDFNNQLLVILGMAQLLESEAGPADPRRRSLGMIREAAERSAGLTRQLLAFSRKQTVQPVVLDLNASLSNLRKTLGRMIGEDIGLVMHLNAAPPLIRIDPTQLEQVVFNLSVNARDAMPNGGRLIFETANLTADDEFARTHLGTAAGAYVRLVVSDSGVGMDKKTIGQIFEPFFTTKGRDKGTGLGLATVYGIVRQAGGAISVYSEPGLGATFTIYLPAAGDAREDRVGEGGDQEPASGGETILLAEDDALVREAARGILEGHGYRVIAVRNADEALEHFSIGRPRPDLVVTDLIMPGMDGRELERRLKALAPEVRVLFMSGYTDDFFGQGREIEEGVEFIQKPFDRLAFLRRVRKILDRP